MRIILGITGSIAAYKSAFLTRGLIKEGHEVKVVMTKDAGHFIAPLTLSTLSQFKVHQDFFNGDEWSNHVELGLWADLIIIAPATANTLAKMANGICDNMLLATYLSAKCDIWFAPAMDLDMWAHPATKKNINTLKSFPKHQMIDVGVGQLASGLEGPGRMAEPEDIIALVAKKDNKNKSLKDIKVLINAGPTREYIDPVRFISNRSTGTMGVAIAEEFASYGANVTLVLGPVDHRINHPLIHVISVQTAQEMYEEMVQNYKGHQVCVFSAAVADYTPLETHQHKVKKSNEDMAIQLKRTIDIAAYLGEKKEDQIHIGFALESEKGDSAAKNKLEKKNFDYIVLNSLQNKGAGFGKKTNQISIYDSRGHNQKFDLKTKTEVAIDIVDYYIKHYNS